MIYSKDKTVVRAIKSQASRGYYVQKSYLNFIPLYRRFSLAVRRGYRPLVIDVLFLAKIAFVSFLERDTLQTHEV